MDDGNADPAQEPRVPTVDDLLLISRLLNDAGAHNNRIHCLAFHVGLSIQFRK